MKKDYYLGLDIGTDSVGWAVSDTDYKIPKFHGNAMWGIRLFDECATAEERRGYRSARRRTRRARERISALEMLFDEEICKKDVAFFQRFRESNLYPEDKTEGVPFCVFADSDYTDKDFHRDFPTVYHLRGELINNQNAPYDIRLVYIALHHIIKHRGHFLFDINCDKYNPDDFQSIYEDFSSFLNENYEAELECTNTEKFAEVLKDKSLRKTEKEKQIAGLFNVKKSENKQLYAILKTLSGSSVKLSDIFDDDEFEQAERKSISFSDKYEENVAEYEDLLGDRFELIEKLKAIYDWGVLAEILNGERYISQAKVSIYNEHSKNLRTLKQYVKSYLPEKYGEIFRRSSNSNNYVAYSGHLKGNEIEHKCDQELFCKYLKKELGECKSDAYRLMFDKIENGTFMPKQVSKANGVIPMQINEIELKAILGNAEKYLPFLTEKDENGLTVSEKIVKIFEYRIPYFVGPLNTHSPKSWLTRKEGKIYPWNIEQIVDYDKSAESFIENLTSKCTYLPKYDVIPKNSLLYSKFTVLNELNNLKIDGNDIDVELKQSIYSDLFLKYNKITKRRLSDYLESKGISYEILSGFDGDFKSSLKAYSDFANYNLSVEDKEEIIRLITIFGDDKKLIRKRIRADFSDKLDDDEINKISKLKYSGWSKLSRELLTKIKAVYKPTGELMSIMEALWNTNLNFMQILYSDDFCFDDNENKTFDKKICELNSFSGEKSLRQAVEELYISPKVKRPVYQSLLIAKEIEKIQKCPAKKIFVEVARGPTEKKRTKSRKQKLTELYNSCKKDYPELYEQLEKTDNERLRSDKLYLYFTQFGRCVYTNEKINLDLLMQSNSRYDIDHIYPRSKIKDDSLDNRVLVNKTVNAGKTNEYPIAPEICARMSGFWKMLSDRGMISKKKYLRLIRNTPLTDDEISSFVARQLVETRQSTKAVAQILEQLYPNTEIVYVRASIASELRQTYDMLKCREVNDFHHAKDAYLNIVGGNVYNVRFTHNKANFVKQLQLNNTEYTVNLDSILKHNIPGAWIADNNQSLKIVKSTMSKNNIRYTRYASKKQGGLFKQQILKKGKGQIPIKAYGARSDIQKYGGYDKAAAAYFAYAKYNDEKGREICQLVPINLYQEKEYRENPAEFVSNIVGFPAQIIIGCVKYNSCISIDGFRMFITAKLSKGKQVEYKPGMQLVLGYDKEKYIKGIVKYLTKFSFRDINESDNITKEQNIELYDLLIQKMTQTVLKKKFGDIGQKTANRRDDFALLSAEEQSKILLEILKILHSNVLVGDLRLIKGAKNAGSVRTNSRLSEIKGAKSIKLIHQSVTGLYEQEIDLLK